MSTAVLRATTVPAGFADKKGRSAVANQESLDHGAALRWWRQSDESAIISDSPVCLRRACSFHLALRYRGPRKTHSSRLPTSGMETSIPFSLQRSRVGPGRSRLSRRALRPDAPPSTPPLHPGPAERGSASSCHAPPKNASIVRVIYDAFVERSNHEACALSRIPW